MTWFLSAPSTPKKEKKKSDDYSLRGKEEIFVPFVLERRESKGGGNAPLTPHAGVHLRNTSPIYMNTCCHAMMMSEAERSGAKWPVDKFLEPGGGNKKKKRLTPFSWTVQHCSNVMSLGQHFFKSKIHSTTKTKVRV